MRTSRFGSFAIGVLASGFVTWVGAVPRLDIAPSATSAFVGNAFMVNVVVSGLTGSPGLALTDYDLDVSYNAALLQATGISFGSGLGSPADIQDSSLGTPGLIDFFAVSFADYGPLRALQGDSFILATLTFAALAPGSSSLSFVTGGAILDFIGASGQAPLNALDPAECQTLGCANVGGGTVVISRRSVVPTPGTLPLALTAWAGWVWVRRRPRKAPTRPHRATSLRF